MHSFDLVLLLLIQLRPFVPIDLELVHHIVDVLFELILSLRVFALEFDGGLQ